jgi:hypothetical protein
MGLGHKNDHNQMGRLLALQQCRPLFHEAPQNRHHHHRAGNHMVVMGRVTGNYQKRIGPRRWKVEDADVYARAAAPRGGRGTRAPADDLPSVWRS